MRYENIIFGALIVSSLQVFGAMENLGNQTLEILKRVSRVNSNARPLSPKDREELKKVFPNLLEGNPTMNDVGKRCYVVSCLEDFITNYRFEYNGQYVGKEDPAEFLKRIFQNNNLS